MSSTKMASSKRKQDEKHLKMLREMAAQPHNKQCFDCHQRGPTYVNMTIGSFVCTSCSGILRGINPPHRVKSISMTSFTPDEMEFLKCHGNDFCRKVYLGLFDSRSGPEPDAREEQKVKDFMVQKYERKRWYVAPTDNMKEEAKQMNEAAMNKQPTTKPLKTLLGDNTPRLVVTNNQSPQPTKAPTTITVTVPTPTQLGTKPAPQDLSFQSPGTQSQSSQSSGSMTMDLLGDLGGDPFASGTAAPAPAPATVQGGSGGGFADFSSFNSQFTAPAHPNPSFQTSANPLLPLASASSPAQAPSTANGAFLGTQPAAVAPPVSTGVAPSGGDKYASLADLFSDSPASSASTQSSSNTLNWSGDMGSSGMSWGGSSNNTPGSGISWDGSGVKNTPTSGGLSWNNTPSTAGGGSAVMSWNNATNNSGSSNMFQSPVISPAAELAPTGLPGNPFVCADTGGANPFGGGSTTVPAQNPMGGASNPFGAPSGGSLFGQQPVSSVGGFGTPAPNSAPGFGQPVGGFGHFGGAVPSSGMGSAQPASAATFGQFGMQNGGGFSSAGNTAVPGGGFGAFSQPQTMSNFGSGPSIAGQYDNKMAGMGGQPQGFPASMGGAGGWGQMQPAQPTANPFMSTASQPVAPKSSSNPFL